MNYTRNHDIVPLPNMARMLRVGPEWLKQQAEEGSVPAIQAGDVWLFNPEATKAVLADRLCRLASREVANA